ncbi:DUF6153 family protein [Streptomyces sp. NPDC090077]|uniref:DUF6153 family protein n=1 Tax=Streptomyces sp. NPDC090077 TaxID=3365938 RepID=UPI003814383C
MTTSAQAARAGRPSGLPARLPVRLLLVLAVLLGIVGMHGLGPGAVPPAAAHAVAAEHPSADEPCDCVHADGPDHEGSSGGHAQHADPTCAASGTSGAPVLHAPAAPGGIPAAAGGPHGTVLGATAYGRAPPSLSELQLLRV